LRRGIAQSGSQARKADRRRDRDAERDWERREAREEAPQGAAQRRVGETSHFGERHISVKCQIKENSVFAVLFVRNKFRHFKHPGRGRCFGPEDDVLDLK